MDLVIRLSGAVPCVKALIPLETLTGKAYAKGEKGKGEPPHCLLAHKSTVYSIR